MKQYCIIVSQLLSFELTYGQDQPSVKVGDLMVIKTKIPLTIGQQLNTVEHIEHEGVQGWETVSVTGVVVATQ